MAPIPPVPQFGYWPPAAAAWPLPQGMTNEHGMYQTMGGYGYQYPPNPHNVWIQQAVPAQVRQPPENQWAGRNEAAQGVSYGQMSSWYQQRAESTGIQTLTPCPPRDSSQQGGRR